MELTISLIGINLFIAIAMLFSLHRKVDKILREFNK